MALYFSSQPGPSRVAPPTPTAEESTPLIPTDHTRTVSNCVNLNTATQNNITNMGGSQSIQATQAQRISSPLPVTTTIVSCFYFSDITQTFKLSSFYSNNSLLS